MPSTAVPKDEDEGGGANEEDRDDTNNNNAHVKNEEWFSTGVDVE